jgi:hypothetical protein
MTSTEDAFARFEAQERARSRFAAQAALSTKGAVFDALARTRVASVTVIFDGSCDDGQIESVDARDAQNATVALPADVVTVTAPLWDGSGVETNAAPLTEAIEVLAYAFLEQTHAGWENDDGAYGEFTFDVASRTVSLEFNERYTATETTTHEF